MTSMRAVIYARTSSSGSQEHRQDTTRQVVDMTAYCTAMGYEITKVYEEHSTAGHGTDRPILNECTDYCKANHIDILVVSELSRINRGSVYDTIEYVKQLLDVGINLYCHKERFTLLDDTGKPSIFAPVLLSCLSLAYSIELQSIKYRLQSGRKRYIEQGGRLGRPPGTGMTKEQVSIKYKQLIKELRRGTSYRRAAKLCDCSESTAKRIKRMFDL